MSIHFKFDQHGHFASCHAQLLPPSAVFFFFVSCFWFYNIGKISIFFYNILFTLECHNHSLFIWIIIAEGMMFANDRWTLTLRLFAWRPCYSPGKRDRDTNQPKRRHNKVCKQIQIYIYLYLYIAKRNQTRYAYMDLVLTGDDPSMTSTPLSIFLRSPYHNKINWWLSISPIGFLYDWDEWRAPSGQNFLS